MSRPFLSIALILLFCSPCVVLSLLCPSGQYLTSDTQQCVDFCPSSYYISIQANQSLCIPHSIISSRLQPTPRTSMFLLVFTGPLAPFMTNEELIVNMNATLLVSESWQVLKPSIVDYLDEGRYMALLYFDDQTIPPGSTLNVEFPSYTPNVQTNTFYIQSAQLSPSAHEVLSSGISNLVDGLTDFDLILEIAWTLLTLFNPYGLVYMNAKFYREYMNLLKHVNVEYEPFLVKFLKANNNKVAGIKLPNFFSILLYENPVTSGWDRTQEVTIQYKSNSDSRLQDLRLITSDRLHEFEPTPLFLDNYGIQLTVLGLCLIIVGVFELIHYLFKPAKSETQLTNEKSTFQAIRVTFRWNLCIATLVGSYQSLIYYSLVQLDSFFNYGNPHNGHNLIDLLFAIFSLIGLGLCLPIFLIYRLRQGVRLNKDRVLAEEHYKHEEILTYYGVFCKFFNNDKLHYPIFILIIFLRSIIFAFLVLFLEDSPSVQLGLMVGLSLAFILYMLVLWPYSKFMYNLLQILYEGVLFAMLSNLLLLSSVDNNDSNMLHREVVSYIILTIWCILPVLCTASGIYGLAVLFFGSQNGNKQLTATVAPEPIEDKQENEETKKDQAVSGTTTTLDQLNGQTTNNGRQPIPSIQEVIDEENMRLEDVNQPQTRPSLIVVPSRKYFF